jgi:hypothetical protein
MLLPVNTVIPMENEVAIDGACRPRSRRGGGTVDETILTITPDDRRRIVQPKYVSPSEQAPACAR